MASPEVSSNPTEFQKIARAAADLEQTVVAYRQYTQLQQELAEAKEMATECAGPPRVLLLMSPGRNGCSWRKLHTLLHVLALLVDWRSLHMLPICVFCTADISYQLL